MSKDPLIEEICVIRDEYARRFDDDIEAMCRDRSGGKGGKG